MGPAHFAAKRMRATHADRAAPSRDARLRASRIITFALLGVLITEGCIHEGIGLGQTPIAVRNESASDLVFRRAKAKWLVPAAEEVELESPGGQVEPIEYEVLDSATCELITTVDVDTVASWDSLIVVPPSGPPTVGPIGDVALRDRPVRIDRDPDLCQGPKDGWTISVVNRSSQAFYLVLYRAPDEKLGRLIDLAAGATGLVDLSSSSGDLDAGSIALLDRDSCDVIDSVDHPAWGRFVVSITGEGEMAIEPTSSISESETLPTAGWSC